MKENYQPLPRIALFIADPTISAEIEQILRAHYSSLLLISNMEKLEEFDLPLIVISDRMSDVAKIHDLKTMHSTRVLALVDAQDNEVISAAFDVGADDYISLPLDAVQLIEKTERYLEEFRAGT